MKNKWYNSFKINTYKPKPKPYTINMSSTTLIDACASGQTEAVERLLSAPDIDVNQTDNNGRTPLYIASENGHANR